MTDIAIVSFAQSPSVRRTALTETQMLVPVIGQVIAESGIPRPEIGFTCSGSCDYLTGATFTFVQMLEATAAWPPIAESHVEADGAWALYEGWVRLQHGDIDSALIYASGKSSLGNMQEVLAIQNDPYYLAPLWADPIGLAGLQAQALLDAGKATERDFAEVASRSRRNAMGNSNAQVTGDQSIDELLAAPYVAPPLRRHDLPPISDCSAAMMLVTVEKAAKLGVKNPVIIRGIDHRVDPHYVGFRDLTVSESTRIAGEKAAAQAGFAASDCDVAELSASFSAQEIVLRNSLGVTDASKVNPSGGALAANPIMVTGMLRIGEAFNAIRAGRAQRAVAHATSGPCLQQNLVCLLEGSN